MRLVRLPAVVVSVAAAVTTATIARTSRADLTGWLYAGGGASWISQQKASYEAAPTMQLDVGLGTPASLPAVVGPLLRTTTYFGHGTDLGLGVRAATRGFAVGDWGVAVDGGGYFRWWGSQSTGPAGSVHVGAPFGLTFTLQGALGSDDHRTFGALLGIDLLRLTVFRLGGENWWINPRPAWRPEPATLPQQR